ESSNLRSSLRFLVDGGRIEELEEPYPWLRFQILDKGESDHE
ncbi:hypothetical protein LCGC14_2045020, partial [marine sediment metagenome]